MDEIVVPANDHNSTFGPGVSWTTNADLLRSIFSLNERGDNARCARVCKGWQDLALDLVWERLISLQPLFCLLPCIEDTRYGLEVIRPVEHTDWERFIVYAGKVRFMSLAGPLHDYSRLVNITDAALLELAMLRPFMAFLPRLVKLRLDVGELEPLQLQFSRLFLHDGLRSLEIRLPTARTREEYVIVFLRGVASLSPGLTSFCLYPSPMAMELKAEVAKLLSHLDDLETLELPRYYISQDIVDQMAFLPHLQVFSEVGEEDDYTSDMSMSMSSLYNPEGHDRNAFTKLKKLDIHGNSMKYITIHLVGYKIGMKKLKKSDSSKGLSENSSTSLEGLIELLCEECPSIRSLEIHVSRNDSFEPLPAITKQTLEPLGRFRCLELVRILYRQPVVLLDDDLLEILSSLTSIKSFHLVWDKRKKKNQLIPSLTLAVLDRLAQVRAMSLRDLKLHVDATQIPEYINTNPTPFAALKRLSLKGSPIGSPVDVALYLSQLIPPSCELAAESASHLGALSNIPAGDAQWTMVRGYLQFSRRVRSADLEAIRALQLQIADLQARLASLSSGEAI